MASKNLLIVHTAPHQDLSDWLEVKRRIDEAAPGIEVKILDNNAPDPSILEWQSSRPSLVFSAYRLMDWQPKTGAVYAGVRMNKYDQFEALARHGFPVPPTYKLTRDFDCDGKISGDYVIAKPQFGFRGKGVSLVGRQELAARYEELTNNDTREMVVQPYIEHSEGGFPTEYRVLTLFGQVLYCARNGWRMPRPQLEQIAANPEGIIASNSISFDGNRQRELCGDPDIISLAERSHVAFPQIAVLGVDVVREIPTGKLYILEVNPRGPWHLSSGLAKRSYPAEHRRNLYAQFNAFDRIARLLIEKTRTSAI